MDDRLVLDCWGSLQMNTFDKIPSYGFVRDWLGSETVARLLSYAQLNEHDFVDSKIASGLDPTRRISKTAGLGSFKSEINEKIRQLVPAMFESLRIAPFEPTFELELVAHGDTAFFARHIDTLKHHHRILSAVYYFYRLPKSFSGGVLRLHSLAASGRQGTFIDISPDYDTLVFFPSIFPHEVLPISVASGEFLDSRFAINCWMYRPGGTLAEER
jgi:Rps23 Pro-64 3,4-dihydroxylase Tpa1-like proline 4-hydroxylase